MNLQNEPYSATENYAWRMPEGRHHSENSDILNIIELDHKELNKMMDVLANSKIDIQEKRSAYRHFSEILKRHSMAEEGSFYAAFKEESSLRTRAFESQTEHEVAKQLMSEIDSALGNDEIWLAKVNVLVNLVENHIKEEESDVFKMAKKRFDSPARMRLGDQYNDIINDLIQRQVRDKANHQPDDQDKHAADDGFSPI